MPHSASSIFIICLIVFLLRTFKKGESEKIGSYIDFVMIYILDDDCDDDERSYAFDMFQKGRTGPIYQGPDDLGFWGL